MSNNRLKVRFSTTTLPCIGCKQEKPVAEFPLKSFYADGTPRYRSRCRPCSNKLHRDERKKRSTDQIFKVEAPINAAVLLMKQKPEVLAEIVRRYHFDYAPLLEQERKRMLDTNENRCHAMHEVSQR